MDQYDIIHAAQGRAMNTYTVEDGKEAIRAVVDRAYNLSEVAKPSAIDYEQTVDDIHDKVLRSYGYITSRELALIAEAGVAGELGGRTRPSAAAFFGWIAAYVASDLRKETIRNYRRNNAGDPASRLKTPDEIAELNRAAEQRAILALWQEYKTSGHISDDHLDGYVAMAMDGATKRGLFAIRDEHWKQAKAQAVERAQRRIGGTWVNRVLPYNPIFQTKRVMLEMCFAGQLATGRDLIVNA